MSGLPVERAHRLADCAEERRWLIDGLWAEEGVGIVGGEPKCCKSFLALDMAVSVAAGTACLRRFAVPRPGRVLLFAAEDALHVVRRRLDGISRAAGVALADVDIHVITAPTVRLDVEADRRSLTETVATLRPRLLILDPFVRLHRIDENVSGEVAPLLAFLRELQRRYQLAVAVVHHARKGAGRARAGQALRGSSEFHAWGDSNLYLRRDGEQLTMAIEHRAAASSSGIALRLKNDDEAIALEIVEPAAASAERPQPDLQERVEEALSAADEPMTIAALRTACRVRNERLVKVLADMVSAGRLRRAAGGGYALSSP